MEKTLASVQKSVPFTQKELMKLEIAQESDPNATLASVMKDSQGGGPKVGTVESGYKFKGGNPSDKNNWEKQ